MLQQCPTNTCCCHDQLNGSLTMHGFLLMAAADFCFRSALTLSKRSLREDMTWLSEEKGCIFIFHHNTTLQLSQLHNISDADGKMLHIFFFCLLLKCNPTYFCCHWHSVYFYTCLYLCPTLQVRRHVPHDKWCEEDAQQTWLR